MIRQTISHYKILEKLGEGGMGVVYKAHDTELDRDVALKFLPHHITMDESEQARFLQEARAAALLNHPNICTVHAIEKWESEQFIVMEFVDGKTLREIIAKGQLKIDNCINYAIQIGEALQEAHSKGIVHRDIKADNIMVNSKNQIKVMDFGLAKLKGSLKLTKTSSTVGTLAYMAPEQIQGGEVDARGDIFSFGVVLYEMLTGHMPFRGEHEAAMMYSIVNEDPSPIQMYLPEISSEQTHILNRSLEKDPEDRYQTVHDMVIDLRRMKKQTSRVSRVIPTLPPSASQATPFDRSVESSEATLKKKNKRILFGAGILMAVAAVASYFLFFAPSSVQLNPNMTSRVLQIPFSQIAYPGLSPDGNWAAFPAADANGKWDIYFMNLSGGEPRRVTNDSDDNIDRADISPDGSQIIYGPNKGNTRQIWSVSALGSDRKILFENATFPVWQPDGKRIFFFRGLYAATVSTSNKLEIWSGKPDGPEERLEFIDTVSTKDRIGLSVSPDGKSVAWTRTIPAKEKYQEVFTHNLETGKEQQLTFDKKKIDEVCWANNNNIVYNTNKGGNTNLWMVPATGGTPTQITKGIGPDCGIRISADSKRLLCYQNQRIGNLWIMSLQDASARQITFDESNRAEASISPDGKQIAYSMVDPDPMKGLWNVYMTDRDGTNRRKVGSGDQHNVFPSWSPDGRWLSFARWNPELITADPRHFQCYVVDAARSNAPKYLADGAPQWISQDEVVTWTSVKSWIVSVRTGERKQFFEDSTNAFPVMGGKYILYKDSRNGRKGVWIVDSKSVSSKARRLLPGKLIDPFYWFIPSMSYNQLRNELVYLTTNHELWKIHVPDGKKEKIQSSFGGIFSIGAFQSRWNEIVYADSRSHGRLVLIENLFK